MDSERATRSGWQQGFPTAQSESLPRDSRRLVRGQKLGQINNIHGRPQALERQAVQHVVEKLRRDMSSSLAISRPRRYRIHPDIAITQSQGNRNHI